MNIKIFCRFTLIVWMTHFCREKVRTIYLDSKYQEDFKVLHILTPIINY